MFRKLSKLYCICSYFNQGTRILLFISECHVFKTCAPNVLQEI